MSSMVPKASCSSQELFQKAVQRGDAMELKRVLQRLHGEATPPSALNVDYFDGDGQTALHHCCMDGNLELVKLLVKLGADARLANRDGWSALHIAAYGGHQEIALYLIANARRDEQRRRVPPPAAVC